MGRSHTSFQATLTRAEKDAAVRAYIVDGHTAPEVSNRAARGELDGAGKFKITAAYVRKLAKAATVNHTPEKLAKPGQAQDAIDQARYGMLALILRDAEKLQAEAKKGKTDLAQTGRLLRAMHEWQRTEGKAQPEHYDDQTTETRDDAASLLAQLEDLTKQRASDKTNGHAETASLSTRVSPGNKAKP
jgi:hypothetical protein